MDNEPILKIRSLFDIYQKCNIVVFEPAEYEKAKIDRK